MDHMVGNPGPSLSVLANCKQSKPGGGIESLAMRLITLSSCKPQKARWVAGNEGRNKAMGHILMITRSLRPF